MVEFDAVVPALHSGRTYHADKRVVGRNQDGQERQRWRSV